MTPEVLEAVIAHELAHIRRFDLWVNLFQRFVETVLFYRPAVWWLSRRVRLSREMCCDELAVAATGECVVYATALEFAAQRRLAPTRPFLEVALGATQMTLLDRVQNVLGLSTGETKGRWWRMVVLGLAVILAICFALALVGNGQYTARSLLRIAMQEQSIVSPVENRPVDRDWFEIYKNTQRQFVLSRFVLLAALRRPEVAKLPSVQQAEQAGDAVEWLMRRVNVSFPGNAEIMEISVRSHDPEEAAILNRAVVDAYLREVVNAEQDQKRQHLNELNRAYVEKETEIRNKRNDLKKLAETLGTSDTGTLSVNLKIALEILALYRQDLSKTQFELQRLHGELAAQQTLLKDVESQRRDDEVDILLESDPIAQKMAAKLESYEEQQRRAEGAGATGDKSTQLAQLQKEVQFARDRLDERRAKLIALERKKTRLAARKEIPRLEASIAVMSEQEQSIQKLVAEQQREAEKVGISSIDVEMMRSEIKTMDAVMADLAREREKVRVEIRAASRVTLIQRADVPEAPDE